MENNVNVKKVRGYAVKYDNKIRPFLDFEEAMDFLHTQTNATILMGVKVSLPLKEKVISD